MSGSLELSEFFNNEDSNGDRLAEFFQKRRGGVRCQNLLFGETEPLRLSVNVQLEKLPVIVPHDDQAKESVTGVKPAKSKIIQQKSVENGQPVGGENAAHIVGVSASANSQENIGKSVSAPPLSPRLAAIRKSGGVSPSDRLRRLSIKRLSNLGFGRRTLLQEFECTMSDSAFSPQICSTPLPLLPTCNNGDTLTKPSANVETIAPRASQEENSSPKERSISRSVSPAKSFGNKGKILRQMMESIVETTLNRVERKNKKGEESEKTAQKKTFEVESDRSSTPSRTYTLEKGQKPGQVILTSEAVLSPKSNAMDISGFLLRNQVHDSSRRVTRASEGKSNCVNVTQKSLAGNNRCSHIRGEVGMANMTHGSADKTQVFHKRSADLEEHNINLCHHTPGAKELSDMDISPLVTHGSQNIVLSNSSNEVHRVSKHFKNRVTVFFNNSHVACSPVIEMERTNVTRNRSADMVNRSRRGGGPSSSKTNCEAGTTTASQIPINQREVSYVQSGNNETAGENELVIPETQDQPAQGRSSIVIESPDHYVPVVVIPVSQTFNQTVQNGGNNAFDQACDSEETTSAVGKSICCSAVTAGPKSTPNKSHVQKATIHDDHSDADNLKLIDVITDDEDEPCHNTMTDTNKSNNSQVPLNLAGGTSSNRMNRLRKYSISRRRLQKGVSETGDSEPLPLTLSNYGAHRKRSNKRRQVTLNKPPGTPLNGEAFAEELARMSNYEILDLRKRNSMGRVFAISGCSSLREKEQAVKKLVDLDDEIDIELLRRNMQMANDDTIHTTEVALTEINTLADDVGREEEDYPPAPKEFADSISLRKEKESSLVDEKSCDRISFRTQRETTLKKRNPESVPEVLQHYLKVSKKFATKKKKKRRSVNHSKRLLYTGGFSDSEDTTCNSSIEKSTMGNSTVRSLAHVPSPPRSELEQMPPLRVVSPPPSLSCSLENLHRTEVDKSRDETVTQASTSKPLPSIKHIEADSGVETNSLSQSQQTALDVGGDGHSDDVFKKPLPPPPLKRKKVGRKKKEDRLESVTVSSEPTMPETSSDTPAEGELRRSKRGHVPLKNSVPLFQLMFQKALDKQMERWEKATARDKKKLRENSRANIDDNRSLGESRSSSLQTVLPKRRKPLATVPETEILGIYPQENAPRNGKKKSKKITAQVTRKPEKTDTLECSRLSLITPPPLDHFNNVFDHLRNSSQISERPCEKENEKLPDNVRQKKLRVRVARVKMTQATKIASKNTVTTTGNSISHTPQQITPENSSAVSSTNDTKQSKFELISWLKNITESENTSRNDEIFKEMRISSASNLCFTELQGIEYAFYDTDDKASLGYLRFQPRQIKPRKRAKRYHLHFVTLVGNFRITANDKESIVGPGDMVAIEKSIYYDIENISDDIGILMVIKK